MSTLAISLEMKSFKKLAMHFSAKRAVMVRGRPGIGKSESVYQVAADLRSDFYKDRAKCEAMSASFRNEASFKKALHAFWKKNDKNAAFAGTDRNTWHYDMGVPVIERRLSQLTEGDIVGIPFEGEMINGLDRGTVFKPTEWLILGCHFPSVLFLDELNRAVKGVEQATFQLADSKAFYGHLLHDETRVYTACNIGDQFDVSAMDPAAISRYAIIDLEPSVADWLVWAGENCNPALVEFMRANGARVLEHKEEFEPHKKYPDRRAWGNLDAELEQSGLYEEFEQPVFMHMAASMVGYPAASAFHSFLKERALDISGEDVLKSWAQVKKRMPKQGSEKWTQKMIELTCKVAECNKKLLTLEQVVEEQQFLLDIPPECFFTLYQSLYGDDKNLIRVIQHGALVTKIQEKIAKMTANPENLKPLETPKPAAVETPPAGDATDEVAPTVATKATKTKATKKAK